MNSPQFDTIVHERCKLIKEILSIKAKEYARGDRLHNFKRAAAFLRGTPEQACWGFAMKHFVSIADLVDDPSLVTRAQVKEKIGDAINYLILLEAIIEERFQK